MAISLIARHRWQIYSKQIPEIYSNINDTDSKRFYERWQERKTRRTGEEMVCYVLSRRDGEDELAQLDAGCENVCEQVSPKATVLRGREWKVPDFDLNMCFCECDWHMSDGVVCGY